MVATRRGAKLMVAQEISIQGQGRWLGGWVAAVEVPKGVEVEVGTEGTWGGLDWVRGGIDSPCAIQSIGAGFIVVGGIEAVVKS